MEAVRDLLTEYNAQLFGSRYMAMKDSSIIVKDSTDWDYAIQWSKEAQDDFMKIDGVEFYLDNPYNDDQHICSFRYFEGGKNINVSMKHDLDLYMDVYRSIDTTFYKKYLWKSNPDSSNNRFIFEYVRDYFNDCYRKYKLNSKFKTFKLGDVVTKIKGSCWTGKVVGFYSTNLTPEGYAVESSTEKGSVQIYPVTALRKI